MMANMLFGNRLRAIQFQHRTTANILFVIWKRFLAGSEAKRARGSEMYFEETQTEKQFSQRCGPESKNELQRTPHSDSLTRLSIIIILSLTSHSYFYFLSRVS
jgi:hypothetical protein